MNRIIDQALIFAIFRGTKMNLAEVVGAGLAREGGTPDPVARKAALLRRIFRGCINKSRV